MSSCCNCPNCGAPANGDKCEYCGTKINANIRVSSELVDELNERMTAVQGYTMRTIAYNEEIASMLNLPMSE